ncbi:hypothetical protein Syun_026410 [Stephania yunnanensis]|uniref:MYND-type domain-containing protein n=1 Tax=Stephania yunnanensis TaxID=152371 RepID=A0AAP0EW56_9MAGN
MCTSMACLLQDQHEQWKRRPEKQLRSVKVFRCQLPRSNPFYSSEPPRNDNTDDPLEPGASLCQWCGTWKGDKVCSSCRSAHYCSEKHQVKHWRSGHKAVCQMMSIFSQSSDHKPRNQRNSSTGLNKVGSSDMWPEFEIICDDEPEFDTEASNCSYSNSLVSKDQMDGTMNSLMSSFEGDTDKRSWASFQERISRAPEQVIRYARDVKARPLWPMPSGQPSKADIPNCNYCNGPLCYEFQILPQLLYYFGVKNDVDSLDWGTIVVYACADSCDASMSYKEEFAWVQLCSSTAVVP